ncbi:MAG: pyrimidine 5'-nucleotidase [Hyphomicrobiales bacterium]|nr:MAG: pyrimidine 5'-nucleotidase [Hyphomicrobiales bacterium]
MRSAFAHIDCWIFDLDNTLYPPETELFAQVDQRMGAFIAQYLGVDRHEARRIQKRYFADYGTTLNGLMAQHGLDPQTYLDYVHDIDHSVVPADPALDTALGRLDGRKLVFTNGTVKHAEQVMKRLGITRHFSDIHDIAAGDYQPKPKPAAYERLLARTGIAPRQAAMFEDIGRNLQVPHALGMATVLVRTEHPHPDRGFGLLGDGGEPYVDHVTDDLAGFLARLA